MPDTGAGAIKSIIGSGLSGRPLPRLNGSNRFAAGVGVLKKYLLLFIHTNIDILVPRKRARMRAIHWVASSKKDLKEMPLKIRERFGFGLYQVQLGRRPENSKILRGFGSSNVSELITEIEDGTFRAVYTIEFENAIFVLHVFQKKSKSGIETPKKEKELINNRIKLAQQEWRQIYGK